MDFTQSAFGQIFTDHMMVCDHADGKWGTPRIEPYAPITLAPSAKVFHYGQTIFEGMKAYQGTNDDIWLFRPKDNIKRLNRSAVRMSMPAFDEDTFVTGLEKLLDLDKDWLLKTNYDTLYIRPFVIATEECVSAAQSLNYKLMIICAPVGDYYGKPVKVLFAEHYSRAASGGVGFAKCGGNYGAQFFPTNLALKKGYQQIIWTDSSTHKTLEEAGTMNIFFKIGDELFTAPTSDRILDGITRKSIIAIAQSKGIKVNVRDISVEEVVAAAKSKELKEIFGTGTAVVVCPITGFGYQGKDYELPALENPLSLQLKTALVSIQRKKAADSFDWTYQVPLNKS